MQKRRHFGILIGIAGVAFLAILLMNALQAFAQSPGNIQSDDEVDSRFHFENNAFLRLKVDALGTDPAVFFRIPVLGVKKEEVVDSWGDSRANGRSHEGTDILAPRGTFIISPTDAIVSRIGTGTNGGKYVYTYNPGGERFYYAHLDEYAEGLTVGQELKMGDLIGFVGNTGNAAATPPHLHLGIYNRGARNPYPRLNLEFSFEETLVALSRVLEKATNPEAMAKRIAAQYKTFLVDARARGAIFPPILESLLAENALAKEVTRDLEVGTKGDDVKKLQEFLITQKAGSAASTLAGAGATGVFGPITKLALIEYQKSVGISPASGYYGPKTRAAIQSGVVAVSLQATSEVKRLTYDLEIGAVGDEVIVLQEFLINANKGAAAAALSVKGATGVFGDLTKKSLIEYQKKVGIIPATGYFGPKTRAHLAGL